MTSLHQAAKDAKNLERMLKGVLEVGEVLQDIDDLETYRIELAEATNNSRADYHVAQENLRHTKEELSEVTKQVEEAKDELKQKLVNAQKEAERIKETAVTDATEYAAKIAMGLKDKQQQMDAVLKLHDARMMKAREEEKQLQQSIYQLRQEMAKLRERLDDSI